MNCSGFLCLAGSLCMAAVAHPGEPSRAREQADRSLTVAAQNQTAYPLWDGKETVAQYARRVNLPETKTLDLGNGVALELVLIPAGKFIMGTPEPKYVDEGSLAQKVWVGQVLVLVGGTLLLILLGESALLAIRLKRRFQYSLRRFMAMIFAASLCVLGGMHWWHSKHGLAEARSRNFALSQRYMDAKDFEKPAHEVTITKPFYMGKYEVTQEQYQQVMGANPSFFRGSNLPVEKVSWYDAKEFCQKIYERLPLTLPSPHWGEGNWFVRLPTEAEWEYACRSGTATDCYFGNKSTDLARAAWCQENSGGTTHPIGGKEPNGWGLYDMHGNVWEWCEDWYGDYLAGSETDPKGAATGFWRVLRGGSWRCGSLICRATWRNREDPAFLYNIRYNDFGFRVVLAGPP